MELQEGKGREDITFADELETKYALYKSKYLARMRTRMSDELGCLEVWYGRLASYGMGGFESRYGM